jgi:hypothetical protein
MKTMDDTFKHLPDREALQVENEILKMKLTLERGGVFGKTDNPNFTPEMEHAFLQSIMEVERQFDEQKTIQVFDKIGRPGCFNPSAELTDEELTPALNELLGLLNDHRIILNVSNDSIKEREVYRFITEDLFYQEIHDFDIERTSVVVHFDKLDDDPEFENTMLAIEGCIRPILEKEPMDCFFYFGLEQLKLNQHQDLTQDEFAILVNMFKKVYDELQIDEINETETILLDTTCEIKGSYRLKARAGKESCIIAGNWSVYFEKQVTNEHWYIMGVEIAGIDF